MYIANPIYDVIFKYMMEDNKIAKKFISAIIGEDVESLDFAPQESVLTIEKDAVLTVEKESYTVCRVDFIARIKTNGLPKVVMIEVQKAKFSHDILRFRRYLGTQYQRSSNCYIDEVSAKCKAMQIYCIFFLGEDLGIDGVPVLEINHFAKDRTTDVELTGLKNEFIDSLHHRSWIVQVPELPKRRRNDLEIMLSIFDQSNVTNDRHILNVKEDDFPKELRSIVRRLQQAAASPKIRETMIGEDDYLEYLQLHERLIEKKDKLIEEKDNALLKKDDIIHEKEDALLKKDDIIHEKDEALLKKDEALLKKDEALQEKEDALLKKEDIIHEKEDALLKKDEALLKKDDIIQEKDEALQEKDKLIAELMRKINNQ